MKVTIKYGVDEVTKNFAPGTTVGQIKSNSNLKAGLGYGDRTRALVRGVEVGDSSVISEGMTILLETASNSKAAEVVVKYGVESFKKHYDETPTVGQIKRDQHLKALFGWGDNLRVVINGVEQPDDALVPSAEVNVETACNTKAVLA